MSSNLSFVTTGDGSLSIHNAAVGENYHSKHGALRESQHVFLQSGLQYFLNHHPVPEVRVLEVGLGTGLNFLLTADFCTEQRISLYYTGIEAHPLPLEMISKTGYGEYVMPEIWSGFLESYPESINQLKAINPYCQLFTAHSRLDQFDTTERYDVLYFDAFAEIHQPEMWEFAALEHITRFLKPNGVFVTYAITGNLKRTMKALGFSIEKAPGAPGKREMLRAIRC